MNKSNAWAWSLMLIATLFFGVGLGLSLGHAIWAPQPTEVADAPENEQEGSRPSTAAASSDRTTHATATGSPRIKTPRTATSASGDYWAARHLFVTVNGQWVADAAEDMLRDLRPGGVLLTESNLGSRAQTFALVREIKQAAGIGDGLGDLPLIAAQQEGGPYNQLAVENAPSAQAVAQSGDPELARKLGREYAEACVGRGIAIAFAPVLDVFEVGAINPGFAARSFGTDQSVVTTFGLAMADGLRQGGVLPVVKHFPGFGAATYGADGLLVVLNKDYGGLARVMYPFNEAVRYGVPGVLVAHVAVPALDPDEPRRSAALSPVLVNDLLRERWGFEGVIIADDVSMNSMTRSIGAEAAAVQALAAGCDAVLFLDPDPNRIRSVASAISAAVNDGTLSREKLERSVERLERWQDAIGNLNPLQVDASQPTEVAKQVPDLSPPPRATQSESPPRAPEQLAAAIPQPSDLPATDPSAATGSAPQAPAPQEPESTPTGTAESVESAATEPSQTSPGTSVPPVAPTAEPEWKPAVTSEPVSQDSPATSSPDPATNNVASAPTQAQSESPTPELELEPAAVEPKPGPSGDAQPEAQQPTPATAESVPETTAKPQVSEPEAAPTETQTAKLDVPPSTPTVTESKPRPAVTAEEAERSSVVHTVKEGELLSTIAQMYAVAVIDLVRWNKLESAQVAPGTVLTVYLTETGAANPADAPKPAAAPPKEEPSEPSQEIAVPAGKLVHTVVEGDTLSTVAEKYGVTIANLALWNGLEDAALNPGQLLTVFLDTDSATNSGTVSTPPASSSPTAPAAEVKQSTSGDGGPVHYKPTISTLDYEIKPGDTLRKIARENETTVETLIELNSLKDANHIMVGSKLKVPAP